MQVPPAIFLNIYFIILITLESVSRKVISTVPIALNLFYENNIKKIKRNAYFLHLFHDYNLTYLLQYVIEKFKDFITTRDEIS